MLENEYLKQKEIAKELIGFFIENGGKLYEDSWTVNYYKLSKVMISPKDEEKAKKFNLIYKKILEFENLNRTQSGGICINKDYLINHPFQYDLRKSSLNVSITFVTDLGCGKIICGYAKKKTIKEGKSGRECALKLEAELKKDGVYIYDYIVSKEKGIEIAKNIHPPRNENYAIQDKTYNNVHHLDFHKFYPSGICMVYPEFKKTFTRLSNSRNKELLDAGTRFWASKFCAYKFAKIIGNGINKAYERFEEVFQELYNSGVKILMVNTDGIWYQGEVFHGKYEGSNLGEWENDYTNCIWRTRTTSTGCYEFIDSDGVYHAKLKGNIAYDKVEPNRKKWQWGDIYKGDQFICKWDDNEGFLIGVE